MAGSLQRIRWALEIAAGKEIAHTHVDDGEGGTKRISVTGAILLGVLDDLEEKADQLRDILWMLEKDGYRRCDNPVCNCGRWHQVGGFYARFKEIEEAVEPRNGEVLLAAVKRKLGERDRAVAALMSVSACGGLDCADCSEKVAEALEEK